MHPPHLQKEGPQLLQVVQQCGAVVGIPLQPQQHRSGALNGASRG